MKIIVRDALRQLGAKKDRQASDDKGILEYIKSHKYYDSALPSTAMVREIKDKLRQSNQQQYEMQAKVEQLSLYLKRDTNRLIFDIFELILKNPGITYKQIGIRIKLEIVNVSHYCCRLRKMNFVELRHDKTEKRVFPKQVSDPRKQDEQEQIHEKVGRPFFFHELSIVDNIWVNVSSVDTFNNKGITNEEIKEKLHKPSETKLVMKLMEQVKTQHKFHQEMVSEGKVFENKYMNVTEQVRELATEEKEDEEDKLSKNVEKWLRSKFPSYKSKKFFFEFINEELKSYFSAHGTKTAKRTCTPIKYIRYVKILNSLNQVYPQTHNELKKFIIVGEKDLPNNGIMHKRSIVGILDGLVQKQILRKEDDSYFPQWEPEGKEVPKRREYDQQVRDIPESRPRKKPHLSSLRQKESYGLLMPARDYKRELTTKLIMEEMEHLIRARLRTALKRMKFARRKVEVQMYEPQTHILHLIGDASHILPSFGSSETYEDFLMQIDNFVQENGRKEQQLNIASDVARIFKRYPFRSEQCLRAKYGNSWMEKISPLVESQCVKIEDGDVSVREDCNRFFI